MNNKLKKSLLTIGCFSLLGIVTTPFENELKIETNNPIKSTLSMNDKNVINSNDVSLEKIKLFNNKQASNAPSIPKNSHLEYKNISEIDSSSSWNYHRLTVKTGDVVEIELIADSGFELSSHKSINIIVEESTSQFLVGHRGASGTAPENTKAAFSEAKNLRFDGIELDVHMTKDNEVVIIHDETVNRTSDISGEIKNMTLSQLKKGNFAAKFGDGTYKKQEIMTLNEFFDEFANSFSIINIELKTSPVEYEGIESKSYNIVKAHNVLDKVLFSSFNFNSLKRIYEIDSEIDNAFLYANRKAFDSIGSDNILKISNFLNPSYGEYKKNGEYYDEFGLMYNFWTVSSESQYEKTLDNSKVFSQISNFMYKNF